MKWIDIRQTYPDQWLIIEALEAYTEHDHRVLDRLAVIETCPNGAAAMQSYRRLHRQYPLREFYFIHTSRKEPKIIERQWAGIRRSHAANPEG